MGVSTRVHGHRSLKISSGMSFHGIVKNCNHKGLGIYYLLSAFIFGISGTLISVLMRIELYSSGNRIISPENQNFYNVNITLHGFLMIFFLVMPGLFGGFGNYFVVIFQGSPEVVYPRVNNFSILILFLSYLLLILSLISEFGGGTGWTLYPPLSTSFMSLSPSSTGNLIFGLLVSGISSCLTSLNFWITIHCELKKSVYQLMIQFIVVSSFFLQDYISFIFSLVFFFVVFFFGVVFFKKKKKKKKKKS